MSFKKTLCVLVAVATMGLTGCKKSTEKIPKDITISGKPISVVYTPHTYGNYGEFAGVFEVEGRLLLAYKQAAGPNAEKFQVVKAAAIVKSEMNDGDEELVNLTGQYEGNQFRLSSVEANGYKIDLE